MKKILSGVMMLGLFAFTSPAIALTTWTLNSSSAIVFGCGGSDYAHTLDTVSQDVDGNLTGTGTYDANNAYTWDLTGNISGDNINFTITYTGISVGSVYNSVGVIAGDGSISGTTDSNCQSFSMPAGSASNDDDNDSVLNVDDLCPGTEPDDFEGWGNKQAKNRWMFDGNNWVKNGDDKTQGDFAPTIEDTYGCSGEQILEELEEATGKDFEGHWKHGVSKSIIEDWISGYYKVDSVVIPADGSTTDSNVFLQDGKDYRIDVSGTYTYWPSCPEVAPCIADAEYSLRPSTSFGPGWVLGDDVFPSTYPEYTLDLNINSSDIDWDNDTTYNADHKYSTMYTGTGSVITFGIYDTGYGDNSGGLSADIFVKLW